MIARRVRLAAGIAAVCLLGSGASVAADNDTEVENPEPVTEEEVDDIVEEAAEDGSAPPKESWISGKSTGHEPAALEEDGPVSEKKVEAVRENAEDREAKAKESWTSGKSTGHEPATAEGEEENDNSKDKDDE